MFAPKAFYTSKKINNKRGDFMASDHWMAGILGIVAVVAIVGMIIMFTGVSKMTTTGEAENIAAQAYRGGEPDGNECVEEEPDFVLRLARGYAGNCAKLLDISNKLFIESGWEYEASCYSGAYTYCRDVA